MPCEVQLDRLHEQCTALEVDYAQIVVTTTEVRSQLSGYLFLSNDPNLAGAEINRLRIRIHDLSDRIMRISNELGSSRRQILDCEVVLERILRFHADVNQFVQQLSNEAGTLAV